jgi:opacity protein-like surface antigen
MKLLAELKHLIVVITLLPLTFYGQDLSETSPKRQSIGFTFSPDYCYRSLNADDENESIASFRDSSETPKFGFTTGFNYAFQLSKRFTLEAGILYAEKGEKLKLESTVLPTNPDDPITSVIFLSRTHYLYLDVPVKLNYFITTKKVKFFVSGAISPNVFLTEKSFFRAIYKNEKLPISRGFGDNGFSRINLAFTAGLGVRYDLSEKFYLQFEPLYRRSITSIINAPIQGYLYSFGLNTGIYYKF